MIPLLCLHLLNKCSLPDNLYDFESGEEANSKLDTKDLWIFRNYLYHDMIECSLKSVFVHDSIPAPIFQQ